MGEVRSTNPATSTHFSIISRPVVVVIADILLSLVSGAKGTF